MSNKILLVEDEALIAMNEARMLQKHGYEVVAAYSGERAIEAVDSDPEISLILMDIDLGKGMDGTDAAQGILKRHDIPIVFLTSHSEKEYVDRVRKITNYGYVLKNSGEFVLIESIHMAYTLFEANRELKTENSARRETEEELSSIYRHTPVLILLLDKERRVRKANAFAVQFAGTPAEEMIGERGGEALRCVHHLDDPQGCGFGPFCKECTVKRTVENTFDNGIEYLKAEATLPFLQQGEKQYLTFLVSTSLLHKEEEDLCLVAFEDITDYKQLQEKYKGLFENAPLPYQSLDKNGSFLEINPAWQEALGGYAREEVIGKPFSDFLHHDVIAEFRVNFEKLKKCGTGEDIIYKMKKRGGDYIDVSFNVGVSYTSDGTVKQTHCIFKDVSEERRIKRKLQESEERYRAIVENINDALIIHDFDGRITFINDNTYKRLNYARDELIGTSIVDLHNYPQRDVIQNIIRENGWPDGEINEIEALSKDGKVLPVEINSTIVSSEGAGEVQTVVRDISGRKQAEKALREKTEMLNNTLKNISDFVVLADNEGNITYHSNVYDTTGYGQDSLIGRNLLEFVHPEDLPEIESNLKEFIRNKEDKRRVEFRFRHADGNYIWIESDGKTIKDEEGNIKELLLSARDVTDRKKTREALEKSEEKYRLLFNYVNDAIFVHGIGVDNLPGKNIDVNEQATRLYGYSREELLNMSVTDVVPEKHASTMYLHVQELMEKNNLTFETEVIRSDNVIFPVEVSAYLYTEGNKKYVISSARDITERKNLEKLKEDVDRITRHDIKTPLNGIINIPQILMDEPNITSEQREFLQMIMDSGRTVLNMIHLSLTIYQIEQGTYKYSEEYFDLLKMCRHCIMGNHLLIESKNIEVVISTEEFALENPERINIFGEKLLAYSVVSNLLKNAVEASPTDSIIHIKITGKASILFSVHNQGAVPEKIRNTFFNKYTTYGKKGGTGIGTYSAKILSEAQGWSIGMQTSEENGTKITITIPKIEETQRRGTSEKQNRR